MSLKNFIAFILAVLVGSQSAFAVGAAGYAIVSGAGSSVLFSQILTFDVTGFPTGGAARQALIEKAANSGGRSVAEDDLNIYIVPNEMSLFGAYCSGALNQYVGIFFRVAPTLEQAQTNAMSTCRIGQINLRSRLIGINNPVNNPIALAPYNSTSFREMVTLNEPIPSPQPTPTPQPPTPSPTPSPQPDTPASNSSAGGGSGNTFLYVGAGAAVVGALYFFTSPDTIGRFSFSPSYNYSLTENGYAYNIGGRWDYQQDNWRLHWTVDQDNSNEEFGNFRYSSGAEYNSGFWAAEFSESVSGKVADYDFSLSAKMDGGNWKISPIYRLQSRYENLLKGWESDTNNSLNLESVLRYNQWTVKPSAGFQWQNVDEFGDNAQFNLSAIWQF